MEAQAPGMRIGNKGRRLPVPPPVATAVTLLSGPNHSPPALVGEAPGPVVGGVSLAVAPSRPERAWVRRGIRLFWSGALAP
eukprot:2067842-Pyramimonas_sp.AAC.1